MAVEIDIVGQAIMQRFMSDASLSSAIADRMYFQQAPQDAVSPYCVFSINSITHEEIMGGADDNITSVTLQFSLFSEDNTGGVRMAGLIALLTECFDWNDLVINGWNCVKMQRVSVDPIMFIDEIWQANVLYELWMQKQ